MIIVNVFGCKGVDVWKYTAIYGSYIRTVFETANPANGPSFVLHADHQYRFAYGRNDKQTQNSFLRFTITLETEPRSNPTRFNGQCVRDQTNTCKPISIITLSLNDFSSMPMKFVSTTNSSFCFSLYDFVFSFLFTIQMIYAKAIYETL